MKVADARASLKDVPLFYSLSNEQLSNISNNIAIKRFNKKEIILPEEDSNEFMYIILFGKVKVFQTTEDGKEIIFAMHKSGDYFGEMSLIDGKTVPATVLAVQDTLTAIISKKDFYTLIFQQRKVLSNLLNILCSRLRKSWFRLKILSFGTAQQRIAGLFFMLAAEYGEKSSEGVVLNLKLTHQDVANMSGLSRETVSRIISRWQKANKVSLLKNKRIRLNRTFLQNAHEYTNHFHSL